MITQLIIGIISVFIAYWLGTLEYKKETDKIKDLRKRIKEIESEVEK
mgnify:CR=1 FL=1